jgi:hypothetical protein
MVTRICVDREMVGKLSSIADNATVTAEWCFCGNVINLPGHDGICG